jgi:hypothetical protein
LAEHESLDLRQGISGQNPFFKRAFSGEKFLKRGLMWVIEATMVAGS